MRKAKSFVDKEGRDIEIYIDEDREISSYHGDERVAVFKFDLANRKASPGARKVDLELRLVDMNVEVDYRRAGVATQMMKVAANVYDSFVLPPPQRSAEAMASDWYLTGKGYKFARYCIEKGILSESNMKSFQDNTPKRGPDYSARYKDS